MSRLNRQGVKPSRLTTFDGYERLAKAALLVALYDAANATDVSRAAEARFWLAFGDGAQIAELLDRASDVRAYLDGLPPLPKQDGACAIVSLARLMRFEDALLNRDGLSLCQNHS